MKKYYISSIALMAILVTSIGGQQSAFAQMGTDALPSGGILDFYEVLDGSGSISGGDFTTMLGGTSAALNAALDSSTYGKVRVTIIQFGGTNVAQVECQQMINNAADVATLVDCISGPGVGPIVKLNGGTPMAVAYNLVTAQLAASPIQGANDRSIVDLVTDGVPNGGTLAGNPTTTAVNAAIAAGLDSNVALAIGAFANPPFLQTLTFPGVSPGPLNPNPLPDPLAQGFVLNVAGFQQFADAMLAKFQVSVATPVGGEFLPIDSAALLLAGAQTNAVWLLSALAVIGSVAFGALYITSKKN
jgi:hypothetical protein